MQSNTARLPVRQKIYLLEPGVSNPSYDPSSAAVGYSLNAKTQSLMQASRNIMQAVSEIQMASGGPGGNARCAWAYESFNGSGELSNYW